MLAALSVGGRCREIDTDRCAIDFHILNFTALSVGILDDVLNVRLTLIPPSGLVKFNI